MYKLLPKILVIVFTSNISLKTLYIKKEYLQKWKLKGFKLFELDKTFVCDILKILTS